MVALFGEYDFCRGKHCAVRAVDKLLYGKLRIGLVVGRRDAVGKLVYSAVAYGVFIHIEHRRGVAVAYAVLHEYLVFKLLVVLHVPKYAPAVFFKLLHRYYARVVEYAERSPEVWHHIFRHIVYVSVAAVECAEHRAYYVHYGRQNIAVAVA